MFVFIFHNSVKTSNRYPILQEKQKPTLSIEIYLFQGLIVIKIFGALKVQWTVFLLQQHSMQINTTLCSVSHIFSFLARLSCSSAVPTQSVGGKCYTLPICSVYAHLSPEQKAGYVALWAMYTPPPPSPQSFSSNFLLLT